MTNHPSHIYDYLFAYFFLSPISKSRPPSASAYRRSQNHSMTRSPTNNIMINAEFGKVEASERKFRSWSAVHAIPMVAGMIVFIAMCSTSPRSQTSHLFSRHLTLFKGVTLKHPRSNRQGVRHIRQQSGQRLVVVREASANQGPTTLSLTSRESQMHTRMLSLRLSPAGSLSLLATLRTSSLLILSIPVLVENSRTE
jgi:hypothetical protein